MREIKNVVICGIGAVGSIYANLINKYDNNNLRILVDENRYEKYIKNPKVFNGEKLDLNYILPNATDFKADLIIIATKYDGLGDAVKNIKNFVKSDTIIMSLLNGITSEEIIANEYGWLHIPHAYFIGHSAMRSGNIITHDGIGYIVFGIKNPQITNIEDKQILQNYFDKVGIAYKTPDDIYRSLWLKYLLNVSSNQLSAILRLTFGQMQNNKKCRDFLTKVMLEIIKIAKACGVNNTETMIEEAFESFDKMIPEGKTSMLQDVESGRKTEAQMFSTTIIELGKKYNIPTPYNEFLKQMLDIIDYNK